MTVKEIKELIENLPDNTEVMVEYDDKDCMIEKDILSAETGFLVDDNGEYLTVFLRF